MQATGFLAVSNYSERQMRQVQRLLDTLDRADERLSAHYDAQRQHLRCNYRGVVTIIPQLEDMEPKITGSLNRFTAWARNISQGGLGFIYPGDIVLSHMLVGLNVDKPNAAWFHSEVARKRRLEEGFLEYGVRFIERVME